MEKKAQEIMAYITNIIWRGKSHPVQEWAKKRNRPQGEQFPAPCPLSDKPGGKKGRPIRHDNDDLAKNFRLNGYNQKIFDVLRRIGGFFYNSVSNKHLLSWLGKILGKANWWKGNYVPFPLPKNKVALAEKIYCDGNRVTVLKVKGKYAYLAAGIGTLTQVEVGTGIRHNSNVRWHVPAGWIEKKLLQAYQGE